MSGDVNYNSVSLLLHFDGANGSTTFTDNSPSPKTPTRSGDAQISTTQSKFGGSSLYLDGTGDCLSVPASDDLNLTGDFTVEAWIFLPSIGITRSIYGFVDSTNTRAFVVRSSGVLGQSNTIHSSGSLSYAFSGTTVLATNTWHHVVWERVGSTQRLFLNGAIEATRTSTTEYIASGGVNIGCIDNASRSPFLGYIDDARITNGVARYAAAFTPPTEAFPNFDTPKVRSSDPGPLGAANLIAYVKPRAIASDPGPLGAELMLAQQWAALVSMPTMLGSANPLAWHLFARADVPSMLGAPNALANHDFTGQLGDAITYYVMDLTTPSGVVRVPISSWQATLQTGLSNYVQCVVPAVQDYVSSINAATQFKISRLVSVPGLPAPLTYEMARGPVQTTTFDRGPFRYTCTISGYSAGFAPNETPNPAYNRTMQGIRSISINQGGRRVRCAIDWLLRPAQRAIADTENFVVSYINYFVGGDDAYMEIGERA